MTDYRRMAAFEGLDGAGKSTQIRLLAETLRASGLEAHVLRLNANPHFKRLCRSLNEDDWLDPTRAALMKAAELSGRLEAVADPLLERGAVVLWDKYVAASLAADAARGAPEPCLRAIEAGLPSPGLTVYLDLAPEEALRRKRLGDGPRPMESGLDLYLNVSVREAFARLDRGEIEAATLDAAFVAFQRRVRAAYDRFLPPAAVRLDGTASPEALSARTWETFVSAASGAVG